MISPDIFKLKPPREHVQYSLTDHISPSLINKHFLNHSVTVVFPDTMNVPAECKNILTSDSEYYQIQNCPLHYLVERPFIEAFISKGEVTLTSVDTCLDVDTCCSVTPSGHLVLSVNRKDMLHLGIEKGPAVDVINFKSINKYLIIIYLKHNLFKPEKNNYKRVLDRLLISNMKFNIIAAWEPQVEKICPSSLAYYFSKKGLKCEECTPSFSEKRSYNVSVPKFQCYNNELFEWLGLFLLDALEMKNDEEYEYLSSYQTPEESEAFGQVLILKLTGLITASRISALLTFIRNYIENRSSIPWVGLHVHGFEDSSVTWNFEPHRYSFCGDNNYTLIFDKSMSVKICKVFTSLSCKD